jgi:hypothetical protein
MKIVTSSTVVMITEQDANVLVIGWLQLAESAAIENIIP